MQRDNREILKVATLAGEKGLAFSVRCLESFIRMARFPFELHIFTDGSIDEISVKESSSFLKGIIQHPLSQREEELQGTLLSYPQLQLFRRNNVLSYKLIDIPLLMDYPFLYIDSDIFFRLPFEFDLPGNGIVCMYDSMNAYCLSPKDLWPIEKMAPYANINTGLVYFSRQPDLQSLEKIADHLFCLNMVLMKHAWAEQTLFALWFSANTEPLFYFNKNQLNMPFSLSKETVAIHYISSYRYLFEEKKMTKNSQFATATISIEKADRRINTFVYLMELLFRKVNHFGRTLLPGLFPLR